MLKIKNLTVKNFMSVGNATQAVDFNRQDLTLVLGENLDLGGDDSGARNGTGKTTIINALSYSLYGQALTNIKRDNLINKTNAKNMLVTVDFEINNQHYRIERGRKPNILKLYINGQEQDSYDDNSQGDSRETQYDIADLIGMSHDMFKHVLALNTYTEPFLSMRANDQRTIIEQLLGITILSEKAEKLKEQIKLTKESITEEDIRIKAVQDANRRIEEQIENLKRRQRLWITKHEDDVVNLERGLIDLANVDIDSEIQAHRDLTSFHDRVKKKAECEKWLRSLRADYAKEERQYSKLEKEIADLQNHKCYACGSHLHDSNQADILDSKIKQRYDCEQHMLTLQEKANEYETQLAAIGDIGTAPSVIYDTLDQALEHRSTLEKLVDQLERKREEEDPYAEQIVDMETSALEEVSWDKINALTQFKEHQDFLLKLLTNKDSFVRKKIIDQNLSYLNARLAAYLQAIGLPHEVKFQNDLTVEITELGRELDFDNLSRGERNRLILSLSWSFRDVWENLYTPVNLLFIDEMIDSGMDSSGVENSLAILKKMSRERQKSIFLISHKDELASRVNTVMKVIKENGFTSYNTDVEISNNI
jgi:DNA repair exonuclease SbcCD ATPase subunit